MLVTSTLFVRKIVISGPSLSFRNILSPGFEIVIIFVVLVRAGTTELQICCSVSSEIPLIFGVCVFVCVLI